MTDMDTRHRRGSRGPALQENVTTAIAAAAFDELAGNGWTRLSMDAVARRAGVGKAAVYRRWPSKETMLLDLVKDLVIRHLPDVPDTGELRGDVRAFLELTVRQAADPRVLPIGIDLLAESQRNPALAAALREAVAVPRRRAAEEILRRAVDRGELQAGLDHSLATDLLISPLFFRLAITSDPVDGPFLDRMTSALVAAMATAGQ
jgi:AcrR family transcriptional regulator